MLVTLIEEPKNLLWLSCTIILGGVVALLFKAYFFPSTFPAVNVDPGEWTHFKAKKRFLADAQGLLQKGTAKYGRKPFRIITTLCERIILPAENTEFVRAHKDLDHQAEVAVEFFGDYPGFEAVGVVNDPEHKLIDAVKIKMTQNMVRIITTISEHMTETLHEKWTENKDWHTIDWSSDARVFIARMSSAVFAGPEMARNEHWQEVSMNYTVKMFNAARALREWPAILRPLVHWVLPECRAARGEIKAARALMGGVLAERKAAKETALQDGYDPPVYGDSIEWMEQIANGRQYDAVTAQLAFAMAALHTTTELLKQALVDIALHPEIVEPLRQEIETSLEAHGWTTAGLYAMKLLDSCVKESFRLKPGPCISLERMALKDVTLSNGAVIPKGSMVAVNSERMWDPAVYNDPLSWDGYRFMKMQEEGKTATAQLASSSPEHMGFGLGRFICPGRFFAANEVKVALAWILSKYDVRPMDGANLDKAKYGFEILAPFEAKLDVRRRSGM